MAIKLKNVLQQAHRQDVAVNRFRISREQGLRIQEIEKKQGHQAACAELLRVLFQRKR